MGESKTRIAMVGAGGMANGVHYHHLLHFMMWRLQPFAT